MTSEPCDDAHGRDALVEWPFPGLRPFRPDEAPVFFGRDEQCDQLLSRLERRRFVGVVGLSGSGKSSLVLAGLIPALERGYLPAAGSSWRIAVVRPGGDPLTNLASSLAQSRVEDEASARLSAADVRRQLDASSLGLIAAARALLSAGSESLLLVVDQFEEIFTFRRDRQNRQALEDAAQFVQLLVSATEPHEVPLYVVLTMRSDYLGDCAQFTGLPEALSDSQFLVPRLTREQLRDVIESPMAIGGATPTLRFVQRLLHDVEALRGGTERRVGHGNEEQDQLPLLQHALMRVWEASCADRTAGLPVDLPHYENPPVETLENALDRHAESAYDLLKTDEERLIVRRCFQRLAERDVEGREVRRPTPVSELAAVALGKPADRITEEDRTRIRDVVQLFRSDRRAFVTINAQDIVDISHETFIRRWSRFGAWLDDESSSRRIYRNLADAALERAQSGRSLYRGPELAAARQWWRAVAPTAEWAARYGGDFDLARRFLSRSVRWRAIRYGGLAVLGIGLVAAGLVEQRRRVSAREQAAELQRLRERDASAVSVMSVIGNLLNRTRDGGPRAWAEALTDQDRRELENVFDQVNRSREEASMKISELPTANVAAGTFLGPTSCAATKCHGSTQRTDTAGGIRISQTAYSTWVAKDRHALATKVLESKISQRIGRILKIDNPKTNPKCLTCHGLVIARRNQAQNSQNDGVSCEVCHGPAGGWLADHLKPQWVNAASETRRRAGMFLTKDFGLRMTLCAECHVGTQDKFVDHQMIAAGHPDLVFDLQFFSANMPPHWREAEGDSLRALVVGRLVYVRLWLSRLARNINGPTWPEKAELDCGACHRKFDNPEFSPPSKPNTPNYPKPQPWKPELNLAGWVVTKPILASYNNPAADQLAGIMGNLGRLVAQRSSDRQELLALTTAADSILDREIQRVAMTSIDVAAATRLLRAVLADADVIARAGERSAEQAYMAIETLARIVTAGKVPPQIRGTLDQMREQLTRPWPYDPVPFIAQMKEIDAAFR